MTIPSPPHTFHEFLDFPLGIKARIAIALLVLPLLLSFTAPLWRIRMVAPQYPKGLHLDIYSYKVEGGNDGHDIVEINNLNHYIGMKTITREELRDLDWIPFALGALALIALRVAALGNVRSLVDLAMLAVYVTCFAFARFIYMLYEFGHNLDPHAPVEVEPFMPVVIGSKKIANFTTWSYPQLGSLWLFLFAGGVWGIMCWYLYTGWRASRRAAVATMPQ